MTITNELTLPDLTALADVLRHVTGLIETTLPTGCEGTPSGTSPAPHPVR